MIVIPLKHFLVANSHSSNIPRGIIDRLSRLSFSEAVYNAATPLYQEAPTDSSGYNFKLKYNPKAGTGTNSNRNRTRTRQIVWFNPLYSLNISTNI